VTRDDDRRLQWIRYQELAQFRLFRLLRRRRADRRPPRPPAPATEQTARPATDGSVREQGSGPNAPDDGS
jgi:hypothetical protein